MTRLKRVMTKKREMGEFPHPSHCASATPAKFATA